MRARASRTTATIPLRSKNAGTPLEVLLVAQGGLSRRHLTVSVPGESGSTTEKPPTSPLAWTAVLGCSFGQA